MSGYQHANGGDGKLWQRLGLVIMGVDSCSKSRGFESHHCILDGNFFTFIWVTKFDIFVRSNISSN